MVANELDARPFEAKAFSMTKEHLKALLDAADAKAGKDRWHTFGDGRHVTLHVARGGAALAISRIEAILHSDEMLRARTSKGEVYVLALEDVFAGAVEAAAKQARKAGFA